MKWAGRTLVRLAVSALLLLWIFHVIFVAEGRRHWESEGGAWTELNRGGQWKVAWTEGPGELAATLSLIRAWPFAVSLFCMGMTIVLGTFRWRQVLKVQGLPLPLGRTVEISLVAHFFNSFLLGSTGGDVLKAFYAARETHHKKTEAVMTVLADRLIGLSAMLLFAAFMMVLNVELLRQHSRLAALAWVILAMLACCAGVVVLSFWGGVSKRLPRARTFLRRLPKGEIVERALEASRLFGKDKIFLAEAFGLSMALNVFCVMQVMALAWGLGLEISPLALFVIVPVIVCLSAIPITPSGLGVRENLYVWMLAAPQIGVDETAALSLSLLAYAGSLCWSLVGGVVYATRKRRDHLPAIEETKEPAGHDLKAEQ